MSTVALSGAFLMLWNLGTPNWQIVATLIVLGLGMGLTQSPVAAAVTLAVTQAQLGVALGIFNMVRFIGASLGSTVFGVVLAGAAAPTSLAPYRIDFALLIVVAAAAAGLALSVPSARLAPQAA
jgi:MFS family permease